MSREYVDSIIVSHDSLKKIQKAQKNIYRAGVYGYSEGKLADTLSASSTILGLAFVASTPVGVAAGIVGLFATMGSGSDKDVILDWIKTGYLEMGDMIDYFEENSNIDRMEIKFPFFEFTQNGSTVRIVTGGGVIGKMHSGHGWYQP
ncbi:MULTISPECIES: hypothetical protein [unclassified Clostridium]|uniref:hypothetical protein n=1 Tax=unclassified Clostridium TaxID=2614128 RepID=UPI0013F07DA2|nr:MULTISPECIES: hypothetical protein [unclassified Clostridium]NFR85915.1 hypothetical protein [Clostridium botulinum]NFR91313.1 hypothetical protein [Clostridium botulinum]NFS30032.1 hypothetical protein [Clostridium botulinum]NFS54532.1 hypothetical protein [Clostridium botulinum]NFT17502.1 hypothetical protein [Clostridium botulinum]